MADLITLTDDSLRRLAEMLRRDQHRPINSPRVQPPVNTDLPGRLVRLARTTTSTAHATYPTAPANAYVVEFGEMVPATDPPVPGVVEFSFEPYTPAEKRVALTQEGAPYYPVDSIVHVSLHHGRWWIQDASGGGYEEFMAELLEYLPRRIDDHTGQPVLAVKRTLWRPDYWGTGLGEWVIDSRVDALGAYDPTGTYDPDGAHNPADEIYVLDGGLWGRQYWGPAGSAIVAAYNPHHLYPDTDGKPTLYIVDMQCPPETEPS
jgi:hypothetical protein